MRNTWRDLVLAVRTAWRSPSYSIVTVLTRALAIGATSTVFSVANPLVLKGLPIAHEERIGWIQTVNVRREVAHGALSHADFAEWRAGARRFSDMAALEFVDATLTVRDMDAMQARVIHASPKVPEIWGLSAIAGRTLQSGDDIVGGGTVGVLSYRFWRERFASDPAIVGRTMLIDGDTTTIVGVMSPDIEVGSFAQIDVWTPLVIDASQPRDRRTLRAFGVLAPGQTLATANAELQGLSMATAALWPRTNANVQATVLSSRDSIDSKHIWVILGLLTVVVCVVLLIACANVASLVQARIIARQHEMAVRLALGASRFEIIRPLLAESVLLSVVGATAGLGLAYAGLRAINAVAYEDLFRHVAVDGNVLLFAAGLSLVTPLFFSLWPALAVGRRTVVDALRDRSGTGPKASGIKRNTLVGAQMALALSLLVMSSLIVQSMFNTTRLDLGLDVAPMLTFRFTLPTQFRDDATANAQFANRLVASLKTLPDTSAAIVLSHLPVFDDESLRTLSGTPTGSDQPENLPVVSWYSVTPEYFGATGVRIVAGRALTANDRADALPVAVVSQTAANRYFGGASSAIGHQVTIAGDEAAAHAVTIVGVSSDTQSPQLTSVNPQLYVPFAQAPSRTMAVLVRSGNPSARVADVRALMRTIDPSIAITKLQPLSATVRDVFSTQRILNALFAAFAVLALLMAAAGLYGVISYSVGQRRREFAVRMALGAAPASIWRMVLVEGLRVTAFGLAIGLALSVVLAHASASLLFGVSASDPATFVGVPTTVALVAVLALSMPALRAMRVDPARALRDG